MIPNHIVVRFADGRLLKGSTQDFAPTKESFHIMVSEGGARPLQVAMRDLKAVFFVRDLVGNPTHDEIKRFGKPTPGRRLEVTFHDGEVMVGTSQAYHPDHQGFFLLPADPDSNNERIYVVAQAVKTVAVVP